MHPTYTFSDILGADCLLQVQNCKLQYEHIRSEKIVQIDKYQQSELTFMWKWAVEYEGDIITVKNKMSKAILYLNGNEIDRQSGLVGASLIGKTSSGKSIRAVLNSGLIKIHVNIYVDDVKVFNN